MWYIFILLLALETIAKILTTGPRLSLTTLVTYVTRDEYFHLLTTDGRTHIYSGFSADPKVVQEGYNTDHRVVQDPHSDCSADLMVVQYATRGLSK